MEDAKHDFGYHPPSAPGFSASCLAAARLRVTPIENTRLARWSRRRESGAPVGRQRQLSYSRCSAIRPPACPGMTCTLCMRPSSRTSSWLLQTPQATNFSSASIHEFDQSIERILLQYLGRSKVAQHIAPYVLCVGARLGGEVRAFQAISNETGNWRGYRAR